MLYDAALRFLAQAHAALEADRKDWSRLEVINDKIKRAQSIISELRGTLNHAASAEISASLDRLYEYYNRRLLEANIKKDVTPLIEVEGLLRELRDGWAEMLNRREDADGPQRRLVRNVA
jgi:flagellar protein FliS